MSVRERDVGPLVRYDKDGAVAWLTLNRPSALNAVNLAMRDAFWSLLEAVRDDPDVRAVVIQGAGDRAFCAGADITEFGTAPSLIEARRARRERDLWELMRGLPKPLVAAVHGWALGAGCEMSLLCDIRIAADDARFGLPEVTLGYIPSAGGTQPMLPTTGSTMTAATPPSASWKQRSTLSRSLKRAMAVSCTEPGVTPGESGVPKVAAPDPALTRNISAWP